MSKKLKFKLNDNEFLLPLDSYREQTWGGNLEKYIHMSAKNTATVIKQYVKKNFPELKVWGVSDTYSGGSSTRIYVCNVDGSPVDSDTYKKIEQWKWILSGGSFNGMEDIYEYREDELTTDNGMALKYFPSYIFIDNKPKWGTVEYWLVEYRTLQDNLNNPDYTRMVELVKKAGSFLEYNKTYMSKGEYNKCVSSGVFS
tara:strand:+ start:232 stop:828 length:597 start_codon:yes stop_codon:yes gene_type:complete